MDLTTAVKIIFFFVLGAISFEFDHLRPVSHNKISFEKVICKYQPGGKIGQYKCLVKYIDRNHLKIDAWANLTGPISNISTQSKFYYKYNIYQQAGGQLNVDVCDWLVQEKRSILLQWIFVKVSKLSIVNYKCPLDGFVYVKADNVSIDEFDFPYLLPSGRYRIDTTVFESNERILFNVSLYFSISDHRLDVSLLKL